MGQRALSGPAGVAMRDERPFAEIVAEAADVLRQDAGEYGYIALLGAIPAAVSVAIAAYIGGAVALALIGPLIIVFSVVTLAACVSAISVGASHLQPDALRAYMTALGRLPAVLLPWVPLAVVLGTATAAFVTFRAELHMVPGIAVIVAFAALSVPYVVPRALHLPALFAEDLSWSQAGHASAALVREQPRRVALALTLAALPAELVFGLALLIGFDAAAGALVVLFLVGAMPLAAALLSLIFFGAEAGLEYEEAPPHYAGTHEAALRSIRTYSSYRR